MNEKINVNINPIFGGLKTLLVQGMDKYTHIEGSCNFETILDKYFKLHTLLVLADIPSQMKKTKFKYTSQALVTS